MTELKDFQEALFLHPGFEAHLEKEITARMKYLNGSNILKTTFDKFGYGVFHRSSVLCGFERIIQDCNISGESAFEIGTAHGLTAIVLSKYFNRVHSVDNTPSKYKQKIVDELGIKNVTFVDIPNNAVKATVAKNISFDFAYVDGDHARDTKSDWNLVKHCGRVLFHEYWPAQEPVFNLVNSLPENQVRFGGLNFAYWQRSDEITGTD